jgi:hypothetical protein
MHPPQRVNHASCRRARLARFALTKQRPIAELIASFERRGEPHLAKQAVLMCRIRVIAIVVTLNLDLQTKIISPRELHKRGIVVVRLTNAGVMRQQHDKITPFADEFGEAVPYAAPSGR